MTSVCSRRREASQARFTYPGRPLATMCCSPTSSPHLVDTKASARRSRSTRPMSSSLVNGPYMSAVSRSDTPRSSAACTARSDSAPRCREVEYAQLIGMHPSPTAPTSSAAAPIVLRSTWPYPPSPGTPN